MAEVITTAFHPDTKIYYRDDEGIRRQISFERLAAIFKSVEKPVIVYSLTNAETVQEANGVGAKSTVLENRQYAVTLSNGAVILCTTKTRFLMRTVNDHLHAGISPITGFTYIAAESLAVGDRIIAKNEAGYLEITAVNSSIGAFQDYIGLLVPMFGNFFIDATGTDGVSVEIVASN